jgi:hypothetical protein
VNDYKLGKTPARPGAASLKLSTYLDAAALPDVPKAFGHQDLVGSFGMLANDRVGDCVWAGAAHETLMWNAEGRRPVVFTDSDVLADYSRVTGYKPSDPSTDQGTDMEVAAKFRRKTGIRSHNGTRHRIAAYLALEGVEDLAIAAYLFGSVGIGVQIPSSAMEQFDAGEPWKIVAGDDIEGGHYVPLVGRASNGHFLVVTWGRVQEVTAGWLRKYVDEALVYLSAEALVEGKSPEGFDVKALTADLAALR